jgi:hypothetical protein
MEVLYFLCFVFCSQAIHETAGLERGSLLRLFSNLQSAVSMLKDSDV